MAITMVPILLSRVSIFLSSQEEGKGAWCVGLESSPGQIGEWPLDREADSLASTAVPDLNNDCWRPSWEGSTQFCNVMTGAFSAQKSLALSSVFE